MIEGTFFTYGLHIDSSVLSTAASLLASGLIWIHIRKR
mgnify:CR=1 FL=1